MDFEAELRKQVKETAEARAKAEAIQRELRDKILLLGAKEKTLRETLSNYLKADDAL